MQRGFREERFREERDGERVEEEERKGLRKRGRRGEEGMEKERKIIYHLRINCNTDDVLS